MPRRFESKKCQKCGQVFTPAGSRSTWCDQCCTITCHSCGKQFRSPRDKIERGTAKYCSRQCANRGQGLKSFAHLCPLCGREVRSSSPQSKYCLSCRTIECSVCGKPFVIQSKHVGKAKYCSNECRSRGKRTHDWTAEDEKFVRENYPFRMSQKELATRFGVSRSAIQRLISRLELPSTPIELRSKRVSQTTRYWTKQRLTAEIRRISENEPLNSAYVQSNYPSLHTVACQRFGSWQEAVEAAGFEYSESNLYANRRQWSIEDIVREIHSLHQQGEDLKASTVRDHHSDLFNAARRDPGLGTWEAAIEAAGISYDDIKGEAWGSAYQGKDGYLYLSEIEGKVGDRLLNLKSKKVITDYHNQVRVVEGRAWTCDFVIDMVDGDQLWLEVDGLGEARADGVYGEGHDKIEYYEGSGLEYAIVRTPKQVEQVIRSSEKRRQNLALEYDAPRNLVELGGNRYTDRELLNELKRVCEELGRPPTYKEMDELGNITASTIKRRLGWANACAEVGFPIREKSELILEDIGKVIEALGRVPSQSEYLRLGRYGAAAISNHFGSYDEAVMVAGYEPPPARTAWDSEKVIASI